MSIETLIKIIEMMISLAGVINPTTALCIVSIILALAVLAYIWKLPRSQR
ncbi:hypothetical protein [Cerasicoccus frondis]|nr:hypothetical protein [Cerasicoccus frondis]